MTKIHCDLIQDLLPLYADGACSEQSKIMIDEHMMECSECKEQLIGMTQSLFVMEPQETVQQEEAQVIRSLAKTWRRTKQYAWIKGGVIATVCCILAIFAYQMLTKWRIVTVPAELIEVSEVYQLSDGSISYRLKVEDEYELTYLSQTYDEQGNSYTVGYRPIIKRKTNVNYASYGFNDSLHRMHPEKENELLFKLNNPTGVQAWYYGSEEDRILIWEQGMEVPDASESLEQYWQNEGELVYPTITIQDEHS